jgi:outer membrane protein
MMLFPYIERWVVVVLLGLILVLGTGDSAWARDKDARIGSIQLSRIFDEYRRTQDADVELEKVGQQKQDERDVTVSEIRRLKDEFELMAETKRAEKQGAIDTKIRELQEFDKKARKMLGTQRDNFVRDILSEIYAVIESYGKAKGFDFILSERTLLYTDGEMDLTNDIISILNEKYEGKNR